VCHLAGRAFDNLNFLDKFLPLKKKQDFRQILRLAALLHDIGHGPLSHISEIAMPPLSKLCLPSFKDNTTHEKATHEHYTIKWILESDIKSHIEHLNIDPLCVAHLINDRISIPDNNFFTVDGLNFKPLLKQIISSDLDVDRMDYLQRDSYFCGTDYGFCDHEWILNNLCVHIENQQAFLGIKQKAIYSVESFLLGRRHINLAVYFHKTLVAMDKMLEHYFASDNCNFHIPVVLDKYLYCTDIALFENLKAICHKNEWAKRIIEKKPYEKIYEIQYTELTKNIQMEKLQKLIQLLEKYSIHFINTHSSDYVTKLYLHDANYAPIYIVDESTGSAVPLKERMSFLNQKENILLKDRVYISPENKKHYSREIENIILT